MTTQYLMNEEKPSRPGTCPSKACEYGYVRVPDWKLKKYVWVLCPHEAHKPAPAAEGETK